MIDHINRDKLDNRIENLRECTASQNQANRRAESKTGVKGVSVIHRKSGIEYGVMAYVNGKQTYFGKYKTLEEAKKVSKSVREKHWGKFAKVD